MRQQTEAGRNAEFNISITKTSGNPQMEANWDGDSNMVASALICLLADLTVGGAADISKTTEHIVDAYREAVHNYCVKMERDQ